MNKGKKKIVYGVIVILIIGIFSSYIYYRNSLKAISTTDDEIIEVEIPSGSSAKAIGERLEKENLIANKWTFLLKTRMLKDQGYLKAGTYNLNKSMDLETIIELFIEGGKSNNTINFTIPEGYEIKDIAEKLGNEGIVDRSRFLELANNKKRFEEEFKFLKEIKDDQSLEGYLFPSTYEIFESHSEEDIIKVMLKAFEGIYSKDIKEQLKNTDLDLNELVTFASIIEREARVDKERPIMAGVIYNRLEIDMRLQVDASVQYALEERKERLLYKDLEIDSPYNTYKYEGLPPGPIASPGKASLLAVINPEDVDYFFYVLKKDGSGEHIFTKTFEEHKNAIQKK